jgi:hypothetical protein
LSYTRIIKYGFFIEGFNAIITTYSIKTTKNNVFHIPSILYYYITKDNMLYATLEEAYNITSFKKPKKKKTLEVEPVSDVSAYDKYESSMVSNDLSTRTTTANQCEPLQAPPYVFPIEKKAKEQYDEALGNMNNIDTKIESNMGDELDSYLNDEEYTEYTEYTDINEPIVNPNDDKNVKNVKDVKTVKTDKTDKNVKNVKDTKDKPSNADKVLERIYELIILLLLALLIVLMCEAIVRIAKN